MELQLINNTSVSPVVDLPFIEANTIDLPLLDIKEHHIIPVFNRDNTPLISQCQFIETTYDVVQSVESLDLQGPFIRVSHPVKGRIPTARHKKAADLLPHEETLYYERMMFAFVAPSITHIINGRELKLVLGGVKAYNKDNMNKFSHQHFQFFIGFQVKVCSNLCIWSDGANLTIKTDSVNILGDHIRRTLTSFEPVSQINQMKQWANTNITDSQFAHLIGKARMYQHLTDKRGIPEFSITDSQINTVVKGYYTDPHFKANSDIDLWSLYNLFTEANKSSYIDSFIDRGVNAHSFIERLYEDLITDQDNWYLWK